MEMWLIPASFLPTAGWKSGDKKIYLTSEVAKIYAYYPAYQPGTNQELATTTALVLSDNTATDNSTIPVTVFLGETDDAHRDGVAPGRKSW